MAYGSFTDVEQQDVPPRIVARDRLDYKTLHNPDADGANCLG